MTDIVHSPLKAPEYITLLKNQDRQGYMVSSISGTSDISRVVANGLCHSCGACSGVCPDDAIRFEETVSGLLFPRVNPDKCSECGRCLAVCPGESFGDDLSGMLPEDPFTGNSLRSFVGKSADKHVYANSQSGGVASGLLIHALRTGAISAAVVVTMKQGIHPRPEAHIASSPEEIIEAQKSKYTPVPLLEVISRLERIRGSVALTGLSCHIHGLIKACELIPDLREKMKYRIGLICDRSLSGVSIDYLALKAGFDEIEQKSIIFRDKSCSGFPGDVRVSSADGRSVILKGSGRKRIKPYLTPPRCHLCFDKMNVLSDVTIGDPHGIRPVDRKNGESICIARNDTGLELVESAAGSGSVTLREIPYSDIVRGQKIDRKRGAWLGFCEKWLSLDRPVPDYHPYVRKNAGSASGHSDRDVRNALTLGSFSDRGKLLDWLKGNDRKDLLRNIIRSVYTYPVLAARKFISILR